MNLQAGPSEMFSFIKVALLMVSLHSNQILMETPNYKNVALANPTSHVLLDSGPGEQPVAPVLGRKLPHDFALP